MEFKEFRKKIRELEHEVDIGTEWNLKDIKAVFVNTGLEVDIGTEWNLK